MPVQPLLLPFLHWGRQTHQNKTFGCYNCIADDLETVFFFQSGSYFQNENCTPSLRPQTLTLRLKRTVSQQQ